MYSPPFGSPILLQIVDFHEGNSGQVVSTTDDRRVVARWRIRDDCRVQGVARSVAAVPDIGPLVAGDNPTDDRRHPAVIRGNQSSRAVVQFQGRISQRIGNAIVLKAYENSFGELAIPDSDTKRWRSAEEIQALVETLRAQQRSNPSSSSTETKPPSKPSRGDDQH